VNAILGLLETPDTLDAMREAIRHDMSARYAWTQLAEVAERAYRYALQNKLDGPP
jgi:hypothetical protein